LCLTIYIVCLIFIGDGQFNPLTKISGAIKNTTSDVNTASMSLYQTIEDSCDQIGECMKRTGTSAVNKTVSKAKESISKIPVKNIADIISKSKCVIPKDADNILRAALLQQCISPSYGM